MLDTLTILYTIPCPSTETTRFSKGLCSMGLVIHIIKHEEANFDIY